MRGKSVFLLGPQQADSFIEFFKAGGTPVPIASPPRLVVSGFYRYARNPIYVGFMAVLIGQALLFGSSGLVEYTVVAWCIGAAAVRFYEEPILARKFGAEYQAYRRGARLGAAPAPVDSRTAMTGTRAARITVRPPQPDRPDMRAARVMPSLFGRRDNGGSDAPPARGAARRCPACWSRGRLCGSCGARRAWG